MLFVFRCITDGGGGGGGGGVIIIIIAYGGMHITGNGCPVPNIGSIHFVRSNIWDAVSASILLLRNFSSTDILFE